MTVTQIQTSEDLGRIAQMNYGFVRNKNGRQNYKTLTYMSGLICPQYKFDFYSNLNESNKIDANQEILFKYLAARNEGCQRYLSSSEDDITTTTHDIVRRTNDTVGDTGTSKMGAMNKNQTPHRTFE